MMDTPKYEAKRFCKGDNAWTDWKPCTEEQAAQYRKDDTFKVRQCARKEERRGEAKP